MSRLCNFAIEGGFMVDTSFKFHKMYNETLAKKDGDWKVYGIPSEEKFPLDDPQHVTLAKGRFYACKQEFRKELAERILYRSLELKMKIKPEGDWFSYLSKDLQKLVTDNFDVSGLHKGKDYPTGLVPDEFLNEAIQSMNDIKGLFAKKILEDAGSLIAKGNSTIPEEEDLGKLFENVLVHIGDVVSYLAALRKEIPCYHRGQHFGLCDMEALKREPRLEEFNAHHAAIIMHEHTLTKNLPASLTTVYRSSFHDRYYDIFGWSIDAFAELLKTETFAPEILIAGGKKIELLALWQEFFMNRNDMTSMVSYSLNTRSIFEELKEFRNSSKYYKGTDGRVVSCDEYGEEQLYPAIIKRCEWLKGCITDAAMGYYKTGLSPEGKDPEKWAAQLTNEVVLMDIVVTVLALGVWAHYNSTMAFFDEVHPKLVELAKEVAKL